MYFGLLKSLKRRQTAPGGQTPKHYLMQFSPDCLYHIYNRGNDKQKIFFQEKNYSFFLNKIKQDLPKLCDILAYCRIRRQTALSGLTPKLKI